MQDPELVKVIILPTYGVLDGYVQIPERIALRHVKAPPDERIRVAQDDQKLEDLASPRGSAPPTG